LHTIVFLEVSTICIKPEFQHEIFTPLHLGFWRGEAVFTPSNPRAYAPVINHGSHLCDNNNLRLFSHCLLPHYRDYIAERQCEWDACRAQEKAEAEALAAEAAAAVPPVAGPTSPKSKKKGQDNNNAKSSTKEDKKGSAK